MPPPKKLKLKKTGDSGSGPHTGWDRKVTIPPGKRHATSNPAGRIVHPRKKKTSGKGIVFGIFGAILAGAALFGIYKYAEMKRIEARREAFALAGYRTRCDEHFGLIAPRIEDTLELQEQANEMLSEVKAAVLFVTRAPLRTPAKKATPETADSSTPPTATTRPAAPAAPAPPAPDRPSRHAGHEEVGGRDALEGIMSLAELKALRKRKSQPQPAPPSEPAATPDEAPPPAPAPARRVSPSRKPRIVVIGRQMLEWQDRIAAKVDAMREVEFDAGKVRATAYRAALSSRAAACAAELEKRVEKVENQHGFVMATVEEMEKGTTEIRGIRDQVDAQRKAAAAEAERRRKAEEHKALVAREKARAIELHRSVVGKLRKYSFARAASELEFAERSFKTDEGKVDLQVYIDRCVRLRDMKTELIRLLNERPFRWGWGLGAVTKDVTGADENAVSVRGETFAWADVSLDQMKKFLDHYAKDNQQKISWRATMLFGSAILMHECDRKTEAGEYAREAARLGAFLRNDVERLLPR